jgi:hypothetical protein
LRKAGIEGQALEDVLSGALDLSPEVTAKRIVEFATSFFGAFQTNNADQEGDAQIDGFPAHQGCGGGRLRSVTGYPGGDRDFADQQRASLAVPPNEVPEEPLAI